MQYMSKRGYALTAEKLKEILAHFRNFVILPNQVADSLNNLGVPPVPKGFTPAEWDEVVYVWHRFAPYGRSIIPAGPEYKKLNAPALNKYLRFRRMQACIIRRF